MAMTHSPYELGSQAVHRRSDEPGWYVGFFIAIVIMEIIAVVVISMLGSGNCCWIPLCTRCANGSGLKFALDLLAHVEFWPWRGRSPGVFAWGLKRKEARVVAVVTARVSGMCAGRCSAEQAPAACCAGRVHVRYQYCINITCML